MEGREVGGGRGGRGELGEGRGGRGEGRGGRRGEGRGGGGREGKRENHAQLPQCYNNALFFTIQKHILWFPGPNIREKLTAAQVKHVISETTPTNPPSS